MKNSVLCIAYFLCALLPSLSAGQMGKAFSFPEGESSRQVLLSDTIPVVCEDWSVNDLTGEPVLEGEEIFKFVDSIHFRSSSPSFFNKDIIQNHYFFLIGPGLDTFHLQDFDYSLLKFLRYKTQSRGLTFQVKDTTADHAKIVQCREVFFEQPIRLKIIEFNKSWYASMYSYSEFWECGAKWDYSPMFPYMAGNDKKGRSFTPLYDPESQPILYFKNLQYALGVLSLDEKSKELNHCKGASGKTTMIATNGRPIDGCSLDLNHDNIPDAFWYTQQMPSDTYEQYTTLFLNIEGDWQACWFSYSVGRF